MEDGSDGGQKMTPNRGAEPNGDSLGRSSTGQGGVGLVVALS